MHFRRMCVIINPMPNGIIKNHIEIHCRKLKTNTYTNEANLFRHLIVFFFLIGQFGRWVIEFTCTLQQAIVVRLLYFYGFFSFLFVSYFQNLQLAMQVLFIGFRAMAAFVSTNINTRYCQKKHTQQTRNEPTHTMAAMKLATTIF